MREPRKPWRWITVPWAIGWVFLIVGCLPAGAAWTDRTHDFEVELGIGYDSNPFLTPDAPYFDQNQGRVVSPRSESGLLLPVRIDGDLTLPLAEDRRAFVTRYRFKGGMYADSATRNADEMYARIEPGIRFDLGHNSRRDRALDLRGFAAYDKEIYFDRDTGLTASSSGIDLADRFTYTSLGAEFVLDYEASKFLTFSAEMRAEARSYRDVAPVESFDQDRYRGQADIVVRLARSARLHVEYVYELQQYAERHARSAGGVDTPQNPLLEYAVSTLESSIRLKPSRPWTVELGLHRRKRADRYVGYNTYNQDRVRLRATLNKDRVWARLTLSYWERDFDRAFIFDQPIDPMTGALNVSKAYETLDVQFHGYVPWKKHLRPFTRIRYVDQKTTDPRFDYDRSQIMTGLEFLY